MSPLEAGVEPKFNPNRSFSPFLALPLEGEDEEGDDPLTGILSAEITVPAGFEGGLGTDELPV